MVVEGAAAVRRTHPARLVGVSDLSTSFTIGILERSQLGRMAASRPSCLAEQSQKHITAWHKALERNSCTPHSKALHTAFVFFPAYGFEMGLSVDLYPVFYLFFFYLWASFMPPSTIVAG